MNHPDQKAFSSERHHGVSMINQGGVSSTHKAEPTQMRIMFEEVNPEFVVRVCEALLSKTDPRNAENVILGGVELKLYVSSHWAGFDRYMLIGQDWTCGFNFRLVTDESVQENVFVGFEMEHEMFTPHLTGHRAFTRDMTVLTMTADDWQEP